MKKFNKEQLEIIKLGHKYNIDTTIYENPNFSVWKMFRIFNALKDGFKNIEHYVDKYDAGQLTQIHRAYKNGYPFGSILDKNYTFVEMYITLNEIENNR